MNCKTQILPTLLAVLAAGSLHAADVSHGKSLQQENCMRCHDDAMYTRENRKVTSLDGLKKQVMRCEQSLGLQWFDEDVADVTEYLNATYYHHK
jgi:cytochrome c553